MEDPKLQLADKLKTANNVLISVSRDPSIDQLAACVGLALLLNKQGKHTAAVFSGKVPSTIDFLQPEETLQKNTDSLRDFIIALDKSKADKLRYKVEDDVVKIFITPYRAAITEDDLEFSQGDFNVDVVVALGVLEQKDLDEAITAHGRILHDATVTSINTQADGALGSINWYDPQASSLSELVTELVQLIGPDQLDGQIATALLTGIVSETERFSNIKTSPQTMSISAALMAAGANQQLVASELAEAEAVLKPKPAQTEAKPATGGALDIAHDTPVGIDRPITGPPPMPPSPEPPPPAPEPSTLTSGSKLMTEPPALGGTLTANSREEKLDPVTDPLSMPVSEPPQLLQHKPEPAEPVVPEPPQPLPPPVPQPPGMVPPPASPLQPTVLNDARDEVSQALAGSKAATDEEFPEPIQSLNAQPLGGDLHPAAPPESAEPKVADPNAPPPVPPPIPFQFSPPAAPPQDKKNTK